MASPDWDKHYHIDTAGRDENDATEYNYPYEPTPYSVLERLAGSGYITKDKGAGKEESASFSQL